MVDILTCVLWAALAANPLNHLVGDWTATGPIAGHDHTMRVTAGWVLNGKYLLIHEADTAGPYEAFIYIGWDASANRHQVHWLDTYGPAYLPALGTGGSTADTIYFTFSEPDGEIFNNLYWDGHLWHWTIMQCKTDGQLHIFARQTLSPNLGQTK